MCDCWMCTQTQEEFDEGLLAWEYQQYKDKTAKPLDMDEWLKSLPSPDDPHISQNGELEGEGEEGL